MFELPSTFDSYTRRRPSGDQAGFQYSIFRESFAPALGSCAHNTAGVKRARPRILDGDMRVSWECRALPKFDRRRVARCQIVVRELSGTESGGPRSERG